MSTSLDGSPPPADPGDGRVGDDADADRPAPGGPRRRRAREDGDPRAGSGTGPEDSGPLWLQEELRRRMEARAAHPARGRHARDDADTEKFGVDALAARLRTGSRGPQTPPAPTPGPRGRAQWQTGAGQGQGQGAPPPSYQAYAGPAPSAPESFAPPAPPAPRPAGPPYAVPNGAVPNGAVPTGAVPNGAAPNGPVPTGVQPGDGAAARPTSGPHPLPGSSPAPADPAASTRPDPGPQPDYLAYADYDDEDDLELDDGEDDQAPFERVLGPASVPLRLPPPEGYADPREATPPPGPGGMRQAGNPMDRAGRRAPAPATLAGPLVAREPAGPTSVSTSVSTTPTGVPGPHSWPGATPLDRADLEATDVGGMAPYADPAPSRDEAPPAAAATAVPEVLPPSRPVGARFDARVAVDDDPDVPKRVRVVLSERKGVARTVRTVVDVQEGTPVGELLRANLIRGQLGVALRVGLVALLVLGALPILFAYYPELGRLEVLGLRLPWLLLGVLVYPFLLGLGWWHTRAAERVEQNFADHVQD
ncbi:hypothetical protein [Pseudonocardia oroxyli]|uniref:hypothetical protein n=1 Tax=Pseudonocardia oroxyli TaxID=366584 RepID=UPI001FE04859|nr:hypothetical protein [Pseudonocardia oroxyli]